MGWFLSFIVIKETTNLTIFILYFQCKSFTNVPISWKNASLAPFLFCYSLNSTMLYLSFFERLHFLLNLHIYSETTVELVSFIALIPCIRWLPFTVTSATTIGKVIFFFLIYFPFFGSFLLPKAWTLDLNACFFFRVTDILEFFKAST